MLEIVVASRELWDEREQVFTVTKECRLVLEHSLVSISKWEARWGEIFLSSIDKSSEQTLDYIRCMTISQNVPDEVYGVLSAENLAEVEAYIRHPMTATILPEGRGSSQSRERISSELIYYWMFTLNIPMECQKWHISRLLTLIHVFDIKNQPAKKRSNREIMDRNRSLNEARRKSMGTRG